MPKDGVGRQIDEEIPAAGHASSHAAQVVIAAATEADFVVAATGPTQYRLSRTYRPAWVVPTAIVGALFFGLGLLLLILVPKRNERCLATVNDGRRGVSVRLSGVLPQPTIDRIRVGLGSPLGSSAGVEAPAAIAPPPLASLPQAPPLRPGSGSAVLPSSTTGSQALSWGPQTGSGPALAAPAALAAPVEATVARVAPHASRRAAGPTIRVGHELVPVVDGVVVGRNPAAVDTVPGAHLLAIGDGGLSKTHFAIRMAGSAIEVCDLSSTNGTVIEFGTVRRQCTPGVWSTVPAGATVVAGGQRMQIV